MSSTWQCNTTRFQEVLNILKQADSSDSNIQLQVTNALNSFVTTCPDAPCYFALVFSGINGESIDMRQRSGLLLKNFILQYGLPTCFEHMFYIKQISLNALNDSQRLIRSTAGTIVTSFLNMKQGKPFLMECLHYLSQLLDMATDTSIDGAFDCLVKICEDEMESCLGENAGVSDQIQQRLTTFLDVSRNIILPKLFQICQGDHSVLSKNEVAIHLSFKCINLYAQYHLFSSGQSLNDMFLLYWQIVGIMAKQNNHRIRLLAVTSIIIVIEDDPDVILDGSGIGIIIDFILSCCEEDNGDSYALRLESLEFWPIYLRNEKGFNVLRPFLPRLLNCLLKNAIFTDFDYIEMDPSHFEDKIEDDQHSVGPRFHQSRANSGESVDDEVEIGAWGNQWTVRKASALALDHISVIYGDEILSELLPKIEESLQDHNWEKQESAILVLGAIARGCLKGLSPFLPKVLTYLVKLTNDPKPLLRSISCWCISRFTPWLAYQQGQAILADTFRALLTRMLDPNKRVQEAACSATATFIEDSSHSLSLIPFLDDIINTISRSLNIYQFRNLLILCDTISTLCFSVGPNVYNANFENNLMPLLISKWRSFHIEHPCLIASMDAIAKIFTIVGPRTTKYVDPIIEHCILNNLFSAITIIKNSEEVSCGISDAVECALDLISSIVEAIRHPAIFILKKYNFLNYLQAFSQESRFPNVQQSAFACIGDIAKYGEDDLEILRPSILGIIEILAFNINNLNIGVANNAIWALGELLVHSSNKNLGLSIEHLIDPIFDALILKVTNSKAANRNNDNLTINACITLGRTCILYSDRIKDKISPCLNRLFIVLTAVRNDQEKINAIHGIFLAIQLNPSSINDSSLIPMLDLINSLQPVLDQKSNYYEVLSPVLQSTFQSIYLSPKKERFIQAIQSHNSYIQGLASSYLKH